MTTQAFELQAVTDEELMTANGGLFWKLPLVIKGGKAIATAVKKTATVKNATTGINVAAEISQHV